MKSFRDICKDFFATNNCDNLINQLKLIENHGFIKPGDYCGFGCEFILNGMDSGNDYFSVSELLAEHYHEYYINNHYLPLINNWDTFLFYSQLDLRGLVFDFSYLHSDDKVICYDGLNGPKNLKKVIEYTIDEFLKEYGLSILYSVSHYNVNWKRIGVKWDN